MPNPPNDNDAGLLSALRRTGSFGGGGEGPDIYKKIIGLDSSQLANASQSAYPDVPAGSRHHALAANMLTQRIAPSVSMIPGGEALSVIAPQVLGAGVEVGEALMGGLKNPHWGQDTWNDLKANLRGSLDAVRKPKLRDVIVRARGLRRKVAGNRG